MAILGDIYIKTDRGELAIDLFNELGEGVLEPAAQFGIRGHNLQKLGRKEDARSEAQNAIAALGDSTDLELLGQVARLLESLDMYDEV